jgi:DNA repair photolyase
MEVSTLFQDWLENHFPARKAKVLERIRAMHDGRLNDSRFGVRMRGEGKAADLISRMFRLTCRRVGLNKEPWPVSPAAFRRPAERSTQQQLRLFD